MLSPVASALFWKFPMSSNYKDGGRLFSKIELPPEMASGLIAMKLETYDSEIGLSPATYSEVALMYHPRSFTTPNPLLF